MKKVTFITAALVSVWAAQAQITITQNDMPQVGDKITQFTDTTITDAGMAGANVTWDYSQAQIHESIEFRMVDVASTGMAALYPNANLAMTTDDVSFSFFNSTSSKYSINGLADSGSGLDPIFYDPEMVVLEFPLNYNNSFSHAYSSVTSFNGDSDSSGFYRLIIRHHAVLEKVVDGWGTIKTPFGTHQALRLKETETATDSVFVQLTETSQPMFMGEDESATVSYAWYTNDIKFPVAVLDQYGNFSFVKKPENSSIEEHKKIAKLISYPNPVEAGYNFSVLGLNDMNYTMNIYDTQGKLVKSEKINGLHVSIPTDGLAPGTYHYNVLATSKSYNGSIIIK